MLEKNRQKEEKRNRPTWKPYYERVTKNKKAYTRNEKHKKGFDE